MLKTREILRLKHEVKISMRDIAKLATVVNRQYQIYSSELKMPEYLSG